MKFYITLALMCTGVLTFDNSTDESRKYYGLNFVKCTDYTKTFRCMSACKSIDFKVFRVDRNCKCTCHEMRTTTILPFFKWRTNGTMATLPRTQSPKLYDIVGTLSPPTEAPPPEPTTNDPPCVIIIHGNHSQVGNDTESEATTVGDGGEGKEKDHEKMPGKEPGKEAEKNPGKKEPGKEPEKKPGKEDENEPGKVAEKKTEKKEPGKKPGEEADKEPGKVTENEPEKKKPVKPKK